MTKPGLCVVSILLIAGLALSLSASGGSKHLPESGKAGTPRIILVQEEEKGEKGGTDPYFLEILKKVQEKLNEWLKSLNERIESQDVTRLEVRFLEILRGILEWVKEKVDAKIQSAEKERPNRKEKGLFRETRQDGVPGSTFRLRINAENC